MPLRSFNIYEAKANLSKLVDAAAGGEDIVPARNGRPLAKFVAYRHPQPEWKADDVLASFS